MHKCDMKLHIWDMTRTYVGHDSSENKSRQEMDCSIWPSHFVNTHESFFWTYMIIHVRYIRVRVYIYIYIYTYCIYIHIYIYIYIYIYEWIIRIVICIFILTCILIYTYSYCMHTTPACEGHDFFMCEIWLGSRLHVWETHQVPWDTWDTSRHTCLRYDLEVRVKSYICRSLAICICIYKYSHMCEIRLGSRQQQDHSISKSHRHSQSAWYIYTWIYIYIYVYIYI